MSSTLRRYAIGSLMVVTAASIATVAAFGGTRKVACPINVLVISNVTGSFSSNGAPVVASIQATVGHINRTGGVLGCKIHVDVADTGSDATKDLPLAERALSTKRYAMVFDSGFGGAAVEPFAASKGELLFLENGTPGVTDPTKYPYTFDMLAAGTFPAVAAANYALSRGIKKIAMLNPTTSTGVAAGAAFKKAFEAGGGDVTDNEQVPGNIVDTTPALLRAKQSGASALFINLFGASAGYVLRDMNAMGWKAPVFGAQGTYATDLASLVSSSQYSNTWVAGPVAGSRPSNKATASFVKLLKAEHVQISQNLYIYAVPADVMTLFAWAANHAKSVSAAAITHYLEKHGRSSVPGMVMSEDTNFTARRHAIVPSAKGYAVAKAGPLVNGQLVRVAYGKFH